MKTSSIESHGTVSSSRRNFLRLTATAAIGGGLTLGFGLPARGEVRDSLTTDAPFAPNAYLRIDRTGKVTFVMPVIEMGQGTYTSVPMLIAEELEVDVDKVAIEHSPPDDKIYVNPLIGVQMTGGSTAIRGTYLPLRRAGATARVLLVTAAAKRWNVEPSTCRAQMGVVVSVNVPNTLRDVFFIEKDTKRFPDTNGWAYALFKYDAASDTFTPDGNDAKCGYACHTTVAAKDYIFTAYPKR